MVSLRRQGMKCAPPLGLWGATAIATLIVLISTYVHSGGDPNRLFNVQRLEGFKAATVRSAPKIVAIGTSLTWSGLFKDKDMENLAARRGIRLSFLRFTYNGGQPEDFTALFPMIIDAHPDLVVIEANLFGLNLHGQSRFTETLNRHRTALCYLVKRSVLQIPFAEKMLGSWTAIKSDRKFEDIHGNIEDIDLVPGLFEPKTIDAYRREAADFQVREFMGCRRFADLFSEAAAAGIGIVFLDIPRAAPAQAVLSDEFKSRYNALMARYEHTEGMAYWRFPSRLPDRDYYDFAHLNAEGRAAYSQWFVSQIPSMLKVTAR